MKPIIMTQGNYGINISGQFLENKIPLNITGKTVDVDIVFPDETTKKYDAVITDEANGLAELLVTAEMTSQVGEYTMYFNLKSGDALITAQKPIYYTITPLDGLVKP